MEHLKPLTLMLLLASVTVTVDSFMQSRKGFRAKGRSAAETNETSFDPGNDTFHQLFARSKRVDDLIDVFSFYDSCGNVKGCHPNGDCFKGRNCDYLINWAFIPVTEYIEFKIFAKKLRDKGGNVCDLNKKVGNDSVQPYLALAFSEGPSMEKAVVFECSIAYSTNSSGGINMGWNGNKQYVRFNHICEEGTRTGKFIYCRVDLDMNAHMSCEFRLKRRVVAMEESYNFAKMPLYMHVASGCNVSEIDDGLQNANHFFSTKERVDLDEYFARQEYLRVNPE